MWAIHICLTVWSLSVEGLDYIPIGLFQKVIISPSRSPFLHLPAWREEISTHLMVQTTGQLPTFEIANWAIWIPWILTSPKGYLTFKWPEKYICNRDVKATYSQAHYTQVITVRGNCSWQPGMTHTKLMEAMCVQSWASWDLHVRFSSNKDVT